MITIKTSYFAKFSRLTDNEKEKYFPIVISTTVPYWYKDYEEHHKWISPKNILPRYKRGEINKEQYTEEYLEFLKQLEKECNIDIYEWYLTIERRENKEVVLLCYEKGEDFCHRHILSKYLENKHNIKIDEL